MQRYQAVLAVIADSRGAGEVAGHFGMSRRSVHARYLRYEDQGLEGLADWSHKPGSMLDQMPAHVEAAVLGLRAGASLLCLPGVSIMSLKT